MAEPASSHKRLSWDEWKAIREAKKRLLAQKGLDAPCNRSTAKPVAKAAAERIREWRRRNSS